MATPRWVGVFGLDEPLLCPYGHQFATIDVWSDERDLACNEKGKDGRNCCPALLYVLGGALRLRGKAVVIVCEVSAVELKYLKNSKMNVEEIMRFLRDNWKTRDAA